MGWHGLCPRGNTISIDGLTSAKELEVYIVVKDAAGMSATR